MGVYIKGVTKSQLMKVIINSTEFMPDDFEVIEVKTPHGRLGDLDELFDRLKKWKNHDRPIYECIEKRMGTQEVYSVEHLEAMLVGVKTTPTVIEAEVE